MKMKLFLVFLLPFIFHDSIISAETDFIVLRSKPHGMFSMFHFVLFFLQEYERDKINGLHVDFAKTGLYYDEKMGLNWWEYYFEPIILGNENSSRRTTCIEEDTHIDPNSIEFSNSIEDNHELIVKYIRVKSHILSKVDCFIEDNFPGKFVIGIHYRGTDKLYYEAPRVDYSDVIKNINVVTESIPEETDYKIFIATDEEAFLDFMLKRFPGRVCYFEIKRSTDGQPLHLDQSRDPYQAGESALIDALVLSRSDFLIRTSSNLSLCSKYFNPQLPFIELSQRTQETIPCAEFYP